MPLGSGLDSGPLFPQAFTLDVIEAITIDAILN
jgi:hypothetical protein